MLELKVGKPLARAGLVVREELLSRLQGSEAAVMVLIAPGGYGKTTLLSQFVEVADMPVAWITLDESDSDPGALISALAFSLEEAGLISPDSGVASVSSDAALTRGVRGLLGAVHTEGGGFLIIDNVDQLKSQGSIDVVGAMMAGASERLRVIAGSRPAANLPIPLLRSRGSILELNATDLALSDTEVEELLDSLGVDGDAVGGVIEHTEGWPVGVYLSALAIQNGATHPGTWEINGDHVYLTEYVRQELMGGIGDELESFLLHSSILPRLSGDLCDHVLQVKQSAETLHRLETSNLLIVPMDHTRTWYRYHNLLRDFFRSELHDRYPEAESGLHARASDWYRSNGFVELAIEQSRLAGDDSAFSRLVEEWVRRFYAEGRIETVSRWLDHLEETNTIADHPELAAVAAIARALDGNAGGAERLARYAFNDAAGHPRADEDLGPISLILRSYQASRGPERARRDAVSAHGKLVHPGEWTLASQGALALATIATDGLEAAEPFMIDALAHGGAFVAHPMSTVAKAIRAAAAIRRGEWDRAGEFTRDAVEQIEGNGLTTYGSSCLPYVLATRVALHDGDHEGARAHMSAASAIRPRLSVALPIFSVLTLHEKAIAYIELGEIAGARQVMRDASDILALRPRLGRLVDEHSSLKERLATLPAGSVGAASLTRAELRLLPLLVTHLTYPEIGQRLYVSRHTVKTQAMSIYRKLGVSSRSEAVECAVGIGLIHP